MNNWKLESWTDYWKLFDQLCSTLSNNKKEEIVHQLKDAQKYVNGLIDGWHEFLSHFKTTIEKNISLLNQEERRLSDFLINTLNKSLNRQ